MPATIQRSVTWTGTNTTSNADFEWVNVNSVTWVSRADATEANTSDFTIQDNDTNTVRTSQWEVRHWNYVNDNTLIDSFTITQSADGVVATTQTPTTQAPTTAAPTTAAPTTAAPTTQAPINYSLTLGSGTSGGQAIQFTEANPNSHSISYSQSPNSGTPAVLVGTLPPWLVDGGITNQFGNGIQLSMNSDSSTYPSSSQSYTITYRHGDAPAGQGEDILYLQFVAAPNNAIQVTSTNVEVATEAPNGEGESTYTDNNAGNNPDQAVTYTLSLDPDATLSASQVYWSTSLPSASGHTASSAPYWATALTIDNSPSSGQAQISYSHVDPNAGGPTTPGGPRSAPLTEEQAGTPSGSPGGQAGTQTGSPGSIDTTNQRYVIITHPDDTSHWVAILVTAPLQSITTTTTNPVYNFEFTSVSPGTFTGNGQTIANFNWNGPSTIDAQDPNNIYTYFSVENPQGPASSYISNVNVTNGTVTASVSEGSNNSNGGDTLTINFIGGGGYTLDSASVTSINFSWAPCHVEGTVMNLADGTTKLVEDLQVGDVLASYDIAGLSDAGEWSNYSSQINQFSASSSTATVTSVIAGQHTTYRNFNNGLTKVTSEHPILVKTAGNDILFKQAIDVLVGDSFYTASGWVEITSNELITETVNTYSIDVETEDVYMADGVLFHNSEVREKIE